MDPKTTAVLSLDIQNGLFILSAQSESILPKAIQVVEFSRSRGIPVLHVGLGFEPGYPEIPEGHPLFGALKEKNLFIKGSSSSEVPSSLRQPSDIIIYKQRVSGFSENQLDMVLRAKGIKTIAMMGIATSGIVLSTLRQAFDKDYRCIVIKDACFDSDSEVHRVLTEKVFARMASVVTTEDFTR